MLSIELEVVSTVAEDVVVGEIELEELLVEVGVCRAELEELLPLLLLLLIVDENKDVETVDSDEVADAEVCELVVDVDVVEEVGLIADLESLCEDLEAGVDEELVDELGVEAGTVTVTGGESTLIIEYPVDMTVVALGDGVRVTRTVFVWSGPSIVFVETM